MNQRVATVSRGARANRIIAGKEGSDTFIAKAVTADDKYAAAINHQFVGSMYVPLAAARGDGVSLLPERSRRSVVRDFSEALALGSGLRVFDDEAFGDSPRRAWRAAPDVFFRARAGAFTRLRGARGDARSEGSLSFMPFPCATSGLKTLNRTLSDLG
ncbi:hypothetical protein [Altererythrobacter sp. MTPC7]|uniref:hypothetical protein n=1 Tax=Altererythrobacter sp. MTPC7 TaxID=3056567 RepID=UPI0036F391F2